MTVEIIANSKRALLLRSPVMPAAGFLGYGRAYPGLLEPGFFGALVTRTTTLRPYRPANQHGFARVPGGFILPAVPPNPGIEAMLREYSASWQRWQLPVIVAIAAADAEEASHLAMRLEEEPAVTALELQVQADATEAWLTGTMQAIAQSSELPVLVKLSLAESSNLAIAAAASGAIAITLGTPHTGVASDGQLSGPLYGPGTLPYTLAALKTIRAVCDLPLIASGGVYDLAGVESCLASGAAAVQLDGLIYQNPAQAAAIARSYLG